MENGTYHTLYSGGNLTEKYLQKHQKTVDITIQNDYNVITGYDIGA